MRRVLLLAVLCLLATLPGMSQGPPPPPFWDVEMNIVNLTNAARMQSRLAPLMLDMRLCTAARMHCQEMLAMHYFSHQSPTPGFARVADRVMRVGAMEYDTVGENIARLDGFPHSLGTFDDSQPDALQQEKQALARRMVDGWLESPDHRDNVLRPQFSTVGVGVALDGSRVMAGQVFGQLPRRRW